MDVSYTLEMTICVVNQHKNDSYCYRLYTFIWYSLSLSLCLIFLNLKDKSFYFCPLNQGLPVVVAVSFFPVAAVHAPRYVQTPLR